MAVENNSGFSKENMVEVKGWLPVMSEQEGSVGRQVGSDGTKLNVY